MRKIDLIEVFIRLCKPEYDLLKYINKIQGERSAPINFYNAAEALHIEKDDVRRQIKRLVEAGVLIADGNDFKINSEVFKTD